MALLAAAVQHGHGGVLAAQDQGADAVRAADLVAGDGHRGEPGRGEVHRDLAEGLDRVGVQGTPNSAATAASSVTGRIVPISLLAHMTVARATSSGLRATASRSVVGVNPAVGVDGEVLDGGALVRGEPVDGVEDGVVLDGAGEDPGAGRVGVAARPVQALHGEVVGLRAAGGEDDLAGAGAEGFGEGLAGLLDGAPGAAAGRVQGGGVAGDAQVRGERLDRLGQHRGGRGVVEVSHGGADSTGPGA